jgi:exodeoxyribonuclease-3
LKIATWNVNSLRVRFEQVLAWLDAEEPDVLALQETKVANDSFPVDDFAERGYRAVANGQRAYNGVALVARRDPRDVTSEIADFADTERRVIAASFGAVRVINLYVPNGESIDSYKYRYKLEWLAGLRAHLAREIEAHEHCIVLGDFNIAPEDRDVHDPAAWAGHVLCSEPERRALRAIMDLGLADSFRLFTQSERCYSWWDYRAGAFRRNRGLRIDLILATPALALTCTACRIDMRPRGAARPSDHAPVVAEFTIP